LYQKFSAEGEGMQNIRKEERGSTGEFLRLFEVVDEIILARVEFAGTGGDDGLDGVEGNFVPVEGGKAVGNCNDWEGGEARTCRGL
jgi:hypothetical protein